MNIRLFGRVGFFIFLLSLATGLTYGQPILTGNSLALKDALQASGAIFTGQVLEIGAPSYKALGERSFHGVKVHVTEIFSGSVEAEVLVSLNVKMGNSDEAPPEKGQSYIFFVSKNKSPQLRVLKLLPATSDTIAKVKALIASK